MELPTVASALSMRMSPGNIAYSVASWSIAEVGMLEEVFLAAAEELVAKGDVSKVPIVVLDIPRNNKADIDIVSTFSKLCTNLSLIKNRVVGFAFLQDVFVPPGFGASSRSHSHGFVSACSIRVLCIESSNKSASRQERGEWQATEMRRTNASPTSSSWPPPRPSPSASTRGAASGKSTYGSTT